MPWFPATQLKPSASALLFAALLVFFPVQAFPAEVTLAWDRPDDSKVIGYHIYSAPSGSNYPDLPNKVINDPSQTNCTLTGLTEGEIYGFVATSFDDSGIESVYSNEVFYNVPVTSTQDSDGDGLTDTEETDTYGTDPDSADTDGDGLNDGDEVSVYGTDPTLSDTDGDSSPDGEEVELGYDPTNPESTPETSSSTITLKEEISDTTVSGYSSSDRERNFGGSGYLRLWSDGVRQFLLKMDLNQISQDALVEKAELNLYCTALKWAGDPTIHAYRVIQSWEEGTAAYSYDLPDGATWIESSYVDHDLTAEGDWEQPGGDIDLSSDYGHGSTGLVASGQMAADAWVTLDITPLVQEWVSGQTANLGLLIQAIDSNNNDAFFYSSESDNADLRPFVTIALAESGTEPEKDSDADGLSDSQETGTYGTDPYASDTDADGIDDGSEVSYWGSRWSADPDSDTVVNLLDADSDNDGYLDGEEVQQGYDPSDSSSSPSSGTMEVTLKDEISDTTLDGYSSSRQELNKGGYSRLGIWGDGVRKILLKSDLGSIPQGAQIQKAELKLYCDDLKWPGDPSLEAYRVTTAWTEGSSTSIYDLPDGATWIESSYVDHDLTSEGDWIQPGGDIDLSTDYGLGPTGLVASGQMAGGSWVVLDITALMQGWVSGSVPNNGLILQATDRGNNDGVFHSSEALDKQPVIQVQYESAP